MTRTVPEGLAVFIERFELDQPRIVTLQQIARIAAEFGVETAPALLAHRLRARGWLLPTGFSGAWEFAPGARAGPYSRGGPLLPVHAALALRPDLPIAVALGSAAWMHGLADRAPSRVVVGLLPGKVVPIALTRTVRIVRFAPRLETVRLKGVPVQRIETMLVHMAFRPGQMDSWGAVAEWLGDAAAEADENQIMLELEDRSRAVRTRLAYLLNGVWPALADRLGQGARTTVWFGPRGKLRRHCRRLHVADTLLPFDPSRLTTARSS